MKRLYIGLVLLTSMVPAYANPTWYILSSKETSCKAAAQNGITITPDILVDALTETHQFLKSTTRQIGNRGYEVSVEGKDRRIMFASNLELCKFLFNEMIKDGVVKVR